MLSACVPILIQASFLWFWPQHFRWNFSLLMGDDDRSKRDGFQTQKSKGLMAG